SFLHDVVAWAEAYVAGSEASKSRGIETENRPHAEEIGREIADIDQHGFWSAFFGIGTPTDGPLIRRVLIAMLAEQKNYWWFSLRIGLEAAERGEIDPLFAPSRRRRGQRPFVVDYWRMRAIAHVHFLWGKGLSKEEAFSKVAG